MGSVAMGVGGSYNFEGYTIHQVAHCLYCDKCGSFRIGRRITAKALASILIAAIIAAGFRAGVADEPSVGAWFACFWPVLLFLGMTGVLALGYRCKKCGRIHTSMDNVLNYPEYDRSVLDLPYEAATKLYRDDM